MKALILSLALSQPTLPQPHTCETETFQLAQTRIACCTQRSGRKCCSKSTDRNGDPTGCNC